MEISGFLFDIYAALGKKVICIVQRHYYTQNDIISSQAGWGHYIGKIGKSQPEAN